MYKSLIAATFAFCAVASANAEVQIKFTNTSKWDIHHIYLSPVGENEWGPDQLGDKESDVIKKGSSFTLTNISENKYDLKIVDQDGDECVLGSIKLAASQAVEIDDKDLLECQAATDSATAEDNS